MGNNNSVIGLVGGIACGKSHIAKCLLDDISGRMPTPSVFSWIEADKLAHVVLCRFSVLKHLYKRWLGTKFEDIVKKEWLSHMLTHSENNITEHLTKIEKKKLFSEISDVVFSDKKELRFLETLVHPVVLSQITSIIESKSGIIILDAPLLLETGLDKLCDFIWFINLPFSKRLENFTKRYPDKPPAVIRSNLVKREKNQIGLNEKLNMSDVTLNNDVDMISVLEEWAKEGLWGL
jgi:dephospho-CoA kinase